MKKTNDRVQAIARDILEAFERGAVPKALAQIFLRRDADYPANDWSIRNRLLGALRGHFDARGYRQWKQAGRQVKRGERAFFILVPRLAKVAKDDEPTSEEAEATKKLVGFLAAPVFGYLQTDGDPLPDAEKEAEFLDSLPLLEVARAWDLEVATFNGADFLPGGGYLHNKGISLGVANRATWSHELIHAADDRLGSITKAPGQQLDNEVVAEFGGAVLLEALGLETDSDRGGAWAYIQHYAEKHGTSAIEVCFSLLERTCRCVQLILDTADQLQADAEHRPREAEDEIDPQPPRAIEPVTATVATVA